MPHGPIRKFSKSDIANIIADYNNGMPTNYLGPKYCCEGNFIPYKGNKEYYLNKAKQFDSNLQNKN